MKVWEGMERFLQFSLGSQVGAYGVALIAVIELKRKVQQPPGLQGKTGTHTVRLTAEEWRTVAGIHERKTFERARNKLEELGVLHIERDGKLLVIELWPDIVQTEVNTTCTTANDTDCIHTETENEKTIEIVSESSSPKRGLRTEKVSISQSVSKFISRAKVRRLGLEGSSSGRAEFIFETDVKPISRVSRRIALGTSLGAVCKADDGTRLEKSIGTNCGTSLGTSSETVPVSQIQRVLSREDVVFPKQDVPKNVISYRDNELQSYRLYRYSLNRQSNNGINEITNNDQRSNDCQGSELRTSKHNQRDHEQGFALGDNKKGKSMQTKETLTELALRERGMKPFERISLQEFANYWVEEVGHPLTLYEKEGLDRFLRLGYTEDLLVEALRCAVAADNRRMGYVLGILRNWYQEGVRCLEDVAIAKKRWDDLRFVNHAKIS